MTDSERLDAIGEYGLCLARHDSLNTDGWEETWVCQYGADLVMAPTIREVIDAAVLDIKTKGLVKH